MLLAFLRGADEDGLWIENGGLETLHSYGVNTSNVLCRKDKKRAAADLLSTLPDAHTSFLLNLQLTCVVGDYFFCHAGIRPGIPLQNQQEDDLLWIREEFLNSSLQYEKVIVHGHTPVRVAEIRPNRINVDTGAYMTGVLSCLILEGATRRFLTVDSSSCRRLNDIIRPTAHI
jgi:serine/threonine protein phosphatase 1